MGVIKKAVTEVKRASEREGRIEDGGEDPRRRGGEAAQGREGRAELMSVIVCGQFDILGDECPGCGGYVHRVQHGGFPSLMGFVCDEDCAADSSDYVMRRRAAAHVSNRDLLCICPICLAAGHPTHAERDEYAAWKAEVTP